MVFLRKPRSRIPLLHWIVASLLVTCAYAAEPVRVVSLSAPLTEMVYALDAGRHLVGVSDVSVFPEQVMLDRRSGKVHELGSFSRPDLAALDALHPNLILTSTGFQRGLAAQLKSKGYKVLHFEPTRLADIFKEIEEVGHALGKGKRAVRLTTNLRRELAEIQRRSSTLPRVRVYLEVNHEGPWTVGSKSPLNDLIDAAGGENIFADHDSGVFIASHTEVIRRNPDVILSPVWLNAKVGGIDGIIPLAQIFLRPGYSETSAVRNSRVLYYDSALFKHEGPRQILAIRKLAFLLHPEVFAAPHGTIPWELGRIRP